MKALPFVVGPGEYEPAIDLLGVKITVLAAADATGAYEITLQEGPEGAGPPPHRHAWDESFFVLDGSVEIEAGGSTSVCAPGALVHLPAGTLHGYRFGPGGGRMLEVSHGGAATRMFRNVSREAPEGAADIPKLVRVLLENGVSVAA